MIDATKSSGFSLHQSLVARESAATPSRTLQKGLFYRNLTEGKCDKWIANFNSERTVISTFCMNHESIYFHDTKAIYVLSLSTRKFDIFHTLEGNSKISGIFEIFENTLLFSYVTERDKQRTQTVKAVNLTDPLLKRDIVTKRLRGEAWHLYMNGNQITAIDPSLMRLRSWDLNGGDKIKPIDLFRLGEDHGNSFAYYDHNIFNTEQYTILLKKEGIYFLGRERDSGFFRKSWGQCVTIHGSYEMNGILVASINRLEYTTSYREGAMLPELTRKNNYAMFVCSLETQKTVEYPIESTFESGVFYDRFFCWQGRIDTFTYLPIQITDLLTGATTSLIENEGEGLYVFRGCNDKEELLVLQFEPDEESSEMLTLFRIFDLKTRRFTGTEIFSEDAESTPPEIRFDGGVLVFNYDTYLEVFDYTIACPSAMPTDLELEGNPMM